MIDVLVFETHPAVRAALVRGLEGEAGVVVLQSFSDPHRFADAVERLTPRFAVVGTFGPNGTKAANWAVEKAHSSTRVIAVVSRTYPEDVSDLDPLVTIVEDGPSGHHLAEVVFRN